MQDNQPDKLFLLQNMTELRSILEKKGSLQDFFFDLVAMVSRNMNSPGCSAYLYDSSRDRLVLRAVKGLDRKLVNQFELKAGEGVVGLSFQIARPLYESNIEKSILFRPFPGLAEEQYKSILAVPIRRGTKPIGVIAIWHEEIEHFTPRDTQMLRAIASQLATVLEDAEAFMELSQKQTKTGSHLPAVLSGTGVGKGICIGEGIVFRRKARSFQKMESADFSKANKKPVASDEEGQHRNVINELTRFAGTLRTTKEQLEDIQQSLANTIAEAADLIFSAHMIMLRDRSFSDAMQAEIEQGNTAEIAILTIVNKYVELFSEQQNPRVQEKAQDVLDLGHRLIRNLNIIGPRVKRDLSGQIIVLADTFPSEIVTFAAEKAVGLVLLGGGETAHIALLAKSLNLPAIFVKEFDILNLVNESLLIIDVDEGKLFINPAADVLKEYEKRKQDQKPAVRISIPDRCRTRDGKSVKIMANVNLIQDVSYALEQKAEGIGLYRSEFPFLVRNGFPSEEDQISIYKRIIEPMGKKEVIIRTLDVGGDKLIGYNPKHQEANPFLGYRGIRFSLGNEDIFLEQLKAILRAGWKGNIGILFPMIGSLEEFIQARDLVYKSMEELAKDGIPFCEKPKIGAMIEIPSAAEIVGELSEESDFLSIGSNDLIMYLLAVDRTNEKVEALHKPYHPAVLRVFNRITDEVGVKISELSICGEAGSNPALIPFFLGRGIHKLSVDPHKISGLKDYVSMIRSKGAEKIADEMLSLKKLSDIEAYLREEVLDEQQDGELFVGS